MIQWLRPTRDPKVTIRLPSSQQSSVISALQPGSLIYCVGGGSPPPNTSDFLWVTNTAYTLQAFYLTSDQPVQCQWHVFFHCSLYGAGYAPVCIFITAQPCWYSVQGRTKNTPTCAGSGKHDLTRVVERGKIPRGQSTVVPQRGSARGSQRPFSDLTQRHIERGQSARDSHQQFGANAAAALLNHQQQQQCMHLWVFLPALGCWLDPLVCGCRCALTSAAVVFGCNENQDTVQLSLGHRYTCYYNVKLIQFTHTIVISVLSIIFK